jgi:hypothetical protein
MRRLAVWIGVGAGIAGAWLALAAVPALASQTHLFGGTFGSAGTPTFAGANGLAVDQSSGDLLVIDTEVNTVTRWHPDGTPAPFSALGTNVIDAIGSGPPCSPPSPECDGTPQHGFTFKQGPGQQQITVDNSGGATDGDIYVTQTNDAATLKLVDIFSEEGEYLGQISGAGTAPFGAGIRPCGVAVDPPGDLFVADWGESKIYKYGAAAHNPLENEDWERTLSDPRYSGPCNLAAGVDSSAGELFVNRSHGFAGNSISRLNGATGVFEGFVDGGEYSLLSIDPAGGHLYAFSAEPTLRTDAEIEEGKAGNELREFEAAATLPGELISVASQYSPQGSGISAQGIAVDGASGTIYESRTGSGNAGFKIDTYGPLLTLPDVTTGPPEVSGNTSVTLTGTVDPDGLALEECFFEYLSDAEYQANLGNRFAGAAEAPCEEPDAAEVGAGGEPVEVHAHLDPLQSETLYHYRLAAANAAAAEYPEDPTGVPRGAEETLKTPSKPAIKAQWSEAVGSEEATIKATINPENAATTYRFQWGTSEAYEHETPEEVLASGIDAEDHTVGLTLHELAPETTYHWRVLAHNALGDAEGKDQELRTYGPTPSGLPEGRAYELVSPTDKEGGEVAVPFAAGGGAGKTPRPLQSSPSGEAITYGSFTAFGENPASAPGTSQYLSARHPDGWATDNLDPRYEEGGLNDPFVGFSEDLSHAAAYVIEPPLTADASLGMANLYWRENASGALTALTREEHHAVIASGAEYCLSYGGSSQDSTRVFFAAKGTLSGVSPGPAPANGFVLYEWSASRPAAQALRTVSVLPNGAPAVPKLGTGFGAAGGGNGCEVKGALMRQAISAEGQRAIWTYAGESEGAKEPLFDRLGASETVRLDKPNTGVAGAGGEGRYRDASREGSKVFFTDSNKLTPGATAAGESPDLYRYDFAAPAGARLIDLTAPNPIEADNTKANVRGVLGASEEGDYAYFIATGALSGEEENAAHEKAIAGENNLYAWHAGDGVRFIARLGSGDDSDWATDPTKQSARLDAAGAHLAFLSKRSLSGYDNTEASKEDCGNPNFGEEPCSEAFLYDYGSNALICASCNPSGARPWGPASLPGWSTPYIQPRYLSAGGARFFFQSADSLLPTDTNGQQDVYELERPGSGGCSNAGPDFFASAAGCLYLISAGQSQDPKTNDASYLLDASAEGRDVFISTRERLYPSDEDERYDVYDARKGGGFPFEPPLNCEGQCPGEGTGAPAPSSAGTAHFTGPGNPKPRTCPKGRRAVQRHGKRRCVPRHRKRHHHRRRHRRAQAMRGAGR